MTRTRVALLFAAPLAALAFAVTSCGDDAPAEQRLLVLDGIEIRLAEIEPYVAFLDSFIPEGGRKTKIKRVLDEYLVPLRLAQRAFAAERRELKERADALCSVAKNIVELEQQSALIKEKRRSNLSRMHAHLPVAMYAFDALRVGAVSPPLEMPEGWYVVGTYDLRESPGHMLDDYVDALQVGFITHTTSKWLEYYNQQRVELADKATFVHPDYVTAMPDWIRVKKHP